MTEFESTFEFLEKEDEAKNREFVFVDLIAQPGGDYILIMRDVKDVDSAEMLLYMSGETIQEIVNNFTRGK